MIRTYMPNALIRAGLEITKKHPGYGIVTDKLTKEELEALLKKILGMAEERLLLFAETLTNREIAGLCDYFPEASDDEVVRRVSRVLTQVMRPNFYSRLVISWQKYPLKRSLLKLLSINRAMAAAAGFDAFEGRFKKWYQLSDRPTVYLSDVIEYLFWITKARPKLDYAFEKAGLHSNSVLYQCCLAQFMSECAFEELVRFGDTEIDNCIRNGMTPELRKGIMLNLLRCKADERRKLLILQQCYRTIYKRYGIPEQSAFGVNHQQEYMTYLWWYNYKTIEEGFNHDADERRISFWMQYLDKCNITRLKAQQFIIMDFGKCCAVESESIGTLYFFDTTYFNDTVLPYLRKHRAAEGKSWMKNFSEYEYKKTHMGRWESEVPYRMRRLNMI